MGSMLPPGKFRPYESNSEAVETTKPRNIYGVLPGASVTQVIRSWAFLGAPPSFGISVCIWGSYRFECFMFGRHEAATYLRCPLRRSSRVHSTYTKRAVTSAFRACPSPPPRIRPLKTTDQACMGSGYNDYRDMQILTLCFCTDHLALL